MNLWGGQNTKRIYDSTRSEVVKLMNHNSKLRSKLDEIIKIFKSISVAEINDALNHSQNLMILDKEFRDLNQKISAEYQDEENQLYLNELLKAYDNSFKTGRAATLKYLSGEKSSANEMFAKSDKFLTTAQALVDKSNFDFQEKAAAKVHKSLAQLVNIFMFGLMICIVFFGLLTFFIQQITIKQLEEVVNNTDVASVKNLKISDELKKALGVITSNTQSQSAAVDETVSTLDQINQMVNMTAENAAQSSTKANESFNMANDGQTAVTEVLSSLDEINRSNINLMDQIKDNETKMNQVIEVIRQIEAKTNVINDIVFQTKLLSFNASVEAARSGEHGKGFAVVAEEVGALATQSGKAAKEICGILEESIAFVEKTVNTTKVETEKIVTDGKSKIETGVTVAQKCGSILNTVVANVSEVNKRMEEISLASKEQAVGVDNINTAIRKVEVNLKENSEFVVHSEEDVNTLYGQAITLGASVKDLQKLIRKAS